MNYLEKVSRTLSFIKPSSGIGARVMLSLGLMLAAVAGHNASTYATSPTPNAFASVSTSSLYALLESDPQLLTQPNSNRALALEAVTRRSEPFSPIAVPSFGTDNRTRISLFAFGLATESVSTIAVEAEDGASQIYQLVVEEMGQVPECPDVTYIIVRLPEQLGDVGDVLIKISARGLASNRARVGIGHVGGGPPDDSSASPTPTPTPGTTYTITGQVVDNNGSALSGVTVNQANVAGLISRTTLTTTNGNFSFENLPGGENFIITASPTQLFAFNAIFFISLSANGTAVFTGHRNLYNVSGRVTAGSSGLANVAMTCNDGVNTLGALTDSNGNYSFPQLTAGRSLTINAAKSGYVFPNGGSTSILNLTGNMSGIDFAAVAEPPTSPPTIVPYNNEVLADNPQAYWRQSEAAGPGVADASGNGRSATLSGSYGRQAPSLLFNNAPDPAITFSAGSFASNSPFWSSNIGVSADFLIKFASVPNGSGTFPSFISAGSQGSSGGAFIVRYNVPNNSLQYIFNYSGGFADVGAEWVPVVGQVYHIAVTHDYATKTVVIYVDGKPFKSAVVTQTALPFSGNAVRVADPGLSVVIDEPAVYSSALPASRVRAHFAAARGADATQTTYYASPSGSIYARGTYGDPLDLGAALSFSLWRPGTTMIAKNGTYKAPSAASVSLGIWTISSSGTPNARLKFQAETRLGALLDGADKRGHVLNITGSYVDVAGFEIRKQFATRSTSTVNTTYCPITNGAGESLGGVGINVVGGTANRIYYNYIHDVLGDGIDDFSSATATEVYGNIIAHNGWSAPRVVGEPAAGNGHGIYTQNIGTNGQKKIEENLFIDAYSCPVAAKGSGSSYVENYLLRGNVAAYGAFYDVGGGIAGINDITIDGEMLYSVTMAPGYNSSSNRQVSVTNNYVVANGSTPIQLEDFDSLTFTGNETLSLSNAPAGGISSFRLRTGRLFSQSTVNNNVYWHNRTGTANVSFFALGTGIPYIQTNFSAYKIATGWDTNSTYHNVGNALTLPTANKTFLRSLGRYEGGRLNFVVYNWSGAVNVSMNLATSGLVAGQTYKIYNAFNPMAAPVSSGTFNPSSPTVNLPITNVVSQRYGDVANSPTGTTQFNVFTLVPSN